jgi:Protein of unknown function (DUF1559)
MISFLSRRAFAVVLLLGLLIPMFAAPGADDKLPADLALVPHDALGFATFRVSDLLGNKDVKNLLPLLQVSSRETLVQAIEKDVGLKIDAIERFTIVFRRMEPGPIWIIRTTKAYDKAVVLKRLGYTEETKVHGKTILGSGDRSASGPSLVVWMPNDRTIVQGQPEALVPYLAALSRPGKTHPFAEELKVASGKHAVVAAALPAMMFRSFDAEWRGLRSRWEKKSRDVQDKVKTPAPDFEKGPPPPPDSKDAPKGPVSKEAPPPPKSRSPKDRPAFDPDRFKEQPLKLRSFDEISDNSDGEMMFVYMPLFFARRALLTIDLGDGIEMKAKADFDSADQAKDAEVVSRMGLYLVRELFPTVLRKEMRLDMKAKGMATVFAQFKDAVRASEVKRDGKTLELTGKAKFDLAPLTAYIAKVVPLRADENNLKQIGIAFLMYHDAMGYMPQAAICDAAGKPLLSWRVAILPYIEEYALYKQFKLDEAWDSPHNKKLIDKMPKIYAAPAGKAEEPNVTFYQVLTGPDTLYPLPNSRRKMIDITDGLSNTLLVVEASKAVPWSKPADIVVPAKGNLPKLGGQFGKFFNALWCDGSVRRIKRDFDQETMRNAIDPADGNILDERKLKP